jgi:hypothetical protein
MKSKNDFTGRPSGAQDVLDPTATGRGVLLGQRLSRLIKELALFLFLKPLSSIIYTQLLECIFYRQGIKTSSFS